MTERVVMPCCGTITWKDPKSGVESVLWSLRDRYMCPACGKPRKSAALDKAETK